jgi:hypothetical protein
VAWGVPQAGAGGALGDDVTREGGASIEPRILTPGALRTEAATVAAIREAHACEGEEGHRRSAPPQLPRTLLPKLFDK